MNAIGMLVYKDLVQQARRLLIGCVILFTFSIVAGLSNGTSIGYSILGTMLAALCMSFALGSLYEDEQGGLVFLRSLPIKAGMLVCGRYLAALLAEALLVASIMIPLLLIRPGIMGITGLGGVVLTAMCSGILLIGFTFTLFYRYGYRAVRSGFLVVFLVMMALQVIVTILARISAFAGPPPTWLEAALTSVYELVVARPAVGLMLALTVVLLLYTFMGWLSVCSLRRRDL